MEEFLTTQETAKLLKLTDGRIRTMILKGIIPAEKFGKQNMIRRSDAEKVRVHGKAGRPKKADAPQVEKPELKTGYSVRDAAEKLGVSRSTMAAMIRDGRLASEKVGRSRIITDDELKRAK